MSQRSVQFGVASHIMVALGANEGEEVPSSLLAHSVNTNASFVRRVLAKLSKAGLVVATRGKGGAVRLARSPGKITMLEIYRASGAPPPFSMHGYPVQKGCPISSNIQHAMEEVADVSLAGFEDSLAKQRLSDVINRLPSIGKEPPARE